MIILKQQQTEKELEISLRIKHFSMGNYDWSRFNVRIPVKSSIQQVYDAWTSPAALESWFLREAVFTSNAGEPVNNNSKIQKGDHYTWHWYGYADDVPERGEILVANGHDYLRFSFGKAGIVNINISSESGETVIDLVQEAIPTDDASRASYHLGCSNGWTFYLANLKSFLEGGLDLRNKNEAHKNVINS
ncbi:SRPBCC domain-containing protein [Chitinophaga sp. MM2321]|uniref:SRPBCC family protein n=1 Tax=Chitinophaga sp. MM2321 TaxID=3137178 RepID=UPI0032D58C7B